MATRWPPSAGRRSCTDRAKSACGTLRPARKRPNSTVTKARSGAVAFSPDGKTLATGSYDGVLKLWDIETGKEKASVQPHKHWITALVFSPDGKLLASASEDMTAKLLDPNTGAEVKALAGHTGSVNGIAFSPDGATVATASGDKTAQLWDVAAGTSKAKLEGHTDGVTSVAFSPDGKTLATGSADRTVKVWDVAAAKEVRPHWPVIKTGSPDVRFSPDGKLLASAAAMIASAKLWNVDARQEIGSLGGFEWSGLERGLRPRRSGLGCWQPG